jgi:hypothetical protein
MNDLQRAIFQAMTQGQQGSEFLPEDVKQRMGLYLSGKLKMPMGQGNTGFAPAGYAGSMQGDQWDQLGDQGY